MAGKALLPVQRLLAFESFWWQDKAENELLGRPLARALNLGLAACAAGHLAVLGPVLNQARARAGLQRCRGGAVVPRAGAAEFSCAAASPDSQPIHPAALPPPKQGHGGWMLPGVAAAWGTALLAALAGLAAPEAAALVEQTAEAARNE